MKARIVILGAGSWGTTFAVLASRNAEVSLWARDAALAAQIDTARHNSRYLPGIALPGRFAAGHDMAALVARADVLVMAVPAQGFRAVLRLARPHLRAWVPVISLGKGLEQGTRRRMTEIIREELPDHPPGVLSGPNLAQEILGGQAAASVLAMDDPAIMGQLQPLFSSGLFRVYTNDDIAGCELGGVLKNVIAIACGMGDGMGAGDNTRAAMITRGLAEITRLGTALGGKAETFAGLAGMGDLVDHLRQPAESQPLRRRATRARTGDRRHRARDAHRGRGRLERPGDRRAGCAARGAGADDAGSEPRARRRQHEAGLPRAAAHQRRRRDRPRLAASSDRFSRRRGSARSGRRRAANSPTRCRTSSGT